MLHTSTFTYRGTYDENWPLPEQLSLEQYRHVFFRPDAHYVEGRIVPRVLGDNTHSRAVGGLVSSLHSPAEALGLTLLPSIRLQTSATRIRVCDLALLCADAPREQVPTVPPSLCIEVLSPGQVASDEEPTLADYLAMGVPNLWLIDPIYRAAFTFDAAGLHETNPTRLTVPGTPIRVDLTAAFASLDRPRPQAATGH